MIYDIAIIGGGAAGLSAAIYAARGGMNTVVFEGTGFGGQVNYTSDVDNYLGIPSVSGLDLAAKMHSHANMFDCNFKSESIREIKEISHPVKKLITRKNIYEAKTIIFATGANPRKLGVLGEDELSGAGVSYCATCDGAFSKGKTAVVVGGGNTAFEDALYLAGICTKVYIINRSDKFRAAKLLVDKANLNPVIEILTNRRIEKIQGDSFVKSVITSNTISGKIEVLNTDAVYIAIGRIPNTSLIKEYVKLSEDGSIVCDEHMNTSVSGVYAAGDVRNTPLRQIVTAASDGAIAATSAIYYINSL
ncbi:MAG: FAD-dependent oxidoreductase [Eubacteriales bacterium]|nr:FAD-dependent oxidoreductase [Eubacteriales bacterium]